VDVEDNAGAPIDECTEGADGIFAVLLADFIDMVSK